MISLAKPVNPPHIINLILDKAARPMLEIVESRELLCTDGKWRKPQGIPHGVEVVKPYEVRVAGYVFRDKNGTTFGTREASADILKQKHDEREAKNRAEFKAILEAMDAKRFASQAEYWLKNHNA